MLYELVVASLIQYRVPSQEFYLPVVPDRPVEIIVEQKKPDAVFASYSKPVKVYKSGKVVKLYKDNTNNCYAWVVKQGYHPVGRGNARNIVTNSRTPKVGGLAVTFESSAGHVMIVVAVSKTTFTIKESNYVKGWITQRTLPINYAKLKGFVI